MIKAIETVYNGYKFRSRLEARWAVFFDALGIKYKYEFEGFDLGNRAWYLPDFFLSDYKMWVEIKPFNPNLDELSKCYKLSDGLDNHSLILYGNPWPGEYFGHLFQVFTTIDACRVCGYLHGKTLAKPLESYLLWQLPRKEQEKLLTEYMIDCGAWCPECGSEWSFEEYPYNYEIWEYTRVIFEEPRLKFPGHWLILWSVDNYEFTKRHFEANEIPLEEYSLIAKISGASFAFKMSKPYDLSQAFLMARQARFEHNHNGYNRNGFN